MSQNLINLVYHFLLITPTSSPNWRQTHLGYWLAQASRQFDARVLALMAANDRMPLALANLARRGHLTASHIHITQHLALEGSRLTEMATRAGISKQAMGKLVDQCEAWGLVQRRDDARDGRAWRVMFTPTGLAWLQAFEEAVTQAQAELHASVGDNVATVIAIGLEAYAA